MRVLVLEDDAELRRPVTWRLRHDGFAVDEVDRLADADKAVRVHDYDCVVADRMVSDGDALDLVARWRSEGRHTMVLFLTARHDPAERVAGLDVGDDYVTKPFDLDELAARVRALCRRWGRREPTVVRVGDVEIDRARREVRRGGVPVPLTPKELSILAALVEEPGVVVSAEELIERCWDDRADLFSRSITVHLSTLRRKLGDPPIIRTIRGVGYAVEADGDGA
jgi:two-component system copper resistance phosphate regulon response regulator CusR